MGWYYPNHCHTKRDLIKDIMKGWKSKSMSSYPVAWCVRGTTLWSVWEIYTRVTGTIERYIRCDLTSKMINDGPWGYKDMDESMHPYYYSCPEKYLKMTRVLSKKWREGVREYHAASKAKRARRKQARNCR